MRYVLRRNERYQAGKKNLTAFQNFSRNTSRNEEAQRNCLFAYTFDLDHLLASKFGEDLLLIWFQTENEDTHPSVPFLFLI